MVEVFLNCFSEYVLPSRVNVYVLLYNFKLT